MKSAERTSESNVTVPAAAGCAGVALGYEPPPGEGGYGRIWVPCGGSHRIPDLDDAGKAKLVAAALELKPEKGGRLVLLGVEVGGLRRAERAALRARIAFLPAAGGLLSQLNAWENIVLPLGYHHPERLKGIATRVHGLLAGLGAEQRGLLDKLPEKMTLYEKKLAGYVRILLEAPDLVLVEDLTRGLNAAERESTAGFFAAYHAVCPEGTFVQLETAPDA